MTQLTGTDVSTAKDINLGHTNFKLIESPKRIVFYDERNDDGLYLRVESNHASIIKDIKSYFDEEYERKGGKFNINEISNYVWYNKLSYPTDNNIYSNISEIGGAYLNIPGKEVTSDQTMANTHFRNNLFVKLEKLEQPNSLSIEQAKKSGYVQGVCECAAVVSGDRALANKLLSEMKVTKAMAKEHASPETYRELEQSVFAPKPKLDQKHGRERHR